jgi:hypothetical protein
MKLDQDHFLPHPFQSFFHHYPTILSYKDRVTNIILQYYKIEYYYSPVSSGFHMTTVDISYLPRLGHIPNPS